MKLNYGDKVIMTEKPGQLTFICFLDNDHDIINRAWREKKKPEGKEERLKSSCGGNYSGRYSIGSNP